MSLHFYSYARKGYEFVDEVAKELKTTDTDKAGRMTRCVIRALRSGLTLEESFGLLAQLPMALKSIYVDGWKLKTAVTPIQSVFDLIDEVIKEDDNSAWRDFSNTDEVKQTIIAVFKVLIKHLSTEESQLVLKVLPNDLRNTLTEITV